VAGSESQGFQNRSDLGGSAFGDTADLEPVLAGTEYH
jgi:hypothetical protein